MQDDWYQLSSDLIFDKTKIQMEDSEEFSDYLVAVDNLVKHSQGKVLSVEEIQVIAHRYCAVGYSLELATAIHKAQKGE